ncbi:hypothetical protein GCU56_16695 [Geodermatophilus sabuli]|uniref:DUF3887 domain-containing protein n=1 Tax=Geodermatophilus sabuli TaxID=1564158 RepID=A0A7K3W6N9_9ACTN|nr:hypothetical protein [Geodermatophilus sabuli]NEK59497.1 hypothetical protein [Geodermatophilus sabuli]
MAPSVSSAGEIQQSGGGRSPSPRHRRTALVGGLAVAAAGVLAAVVGSGQGTPSPPVAFAEDWITAWNDRDAQTVSQMTCHYLPAFTAASTVQLHLDRVPADRPVVDQHAIMGTEPGTAYGREVVEVLVTYVRGGDDEARNARVSVRVRDDGDLCIGRFSAW